MSSVELAPGLVDMNHWHRLHPLSPLVRASRALVPLVVLAGTTGVGVQRDQHEGWHLLVDAAIALLAILLGVVSWLVTRWQVVGGVLQIETGLLRRSSHRYPLSQVQAIDIVETGIARVFGLAELRLRMAGSGRGKSRLAYLPAADTRVLRARLLALAHGVDEGTPEPPERLLLTVPTLMLVASIVLSAPGLIAVAIAIGVTVLAVYAPATAVAFLSAAAASLLALVTALWRRFNGFYNLELAEAPDGFRLRSGLVQTSSETIPVRRVQAVRLTEPLLWRPMGWCRLEVSVAGMKRDRENEAEGRRLRVVLPVGQRAQAAFLLQRLVPAAPTGRRRPPRRAMLKSPLSFHNLAFDVDDRYVLSVTGRVRRCTEWVPLDKVQSIRLDQGPLQRILRLGTMHLDAAGRGVQADLSNRGADEIQALLAVLPDKCRAARTSLR